MTEKLSVLIDFFLRFILRRETLFFAGVMEGSLTMLAMLQGFYEATQNSFSNTTNNQDSNSEPFGKSSLFIYFAMSSYL